MMQSFTTGTAAGAQRPSSFASGDNRLCPACQSEAKRLSRGLSRKWDLHSSVYVKTTKQTNKGHIVIQKQNYGIHIHAPCGPTELQWYLTQVHQHFMSSKVNLECDVITQALNVIYRNVDPPFGKYYNNKKSPQIVGLRPPMRSITL